MTPEELMKPRYKVIADYPKPSTVVVEVGDIFTQSEIMKLFYITGKTAHGSAMEEELQKYPHLFKKLEWWEERLPEEMPEYVRWLFDERKDSKSMDGYVVKVSGWMQNGYSVLTQQGDVIASQFFAPATLSEYNTFIESKK